MHADRPAKALSGPVRVGISACLLGEKVRYDGGHKHDRFLTDTLGKFFQWVPVCPEVEAGMDTPREPIQLVQLQGEIRVVGIHSATDHTDALREHAGGGWSNWRAKSQWVHLEEGFAQLRSGAGTGALRTQSGSHVRAAACSPRSWRSVFRTCRSRRKGVCPTRDCGRTGSSACSRTIG